MENYDQHSNITWPNYNVIIASRDTSDELMTVTVTSTDIFCLVMLCVLKLVLTTSHSSLQMTII